MRKLLLMAFLIGGAMAVLRRMPGEGRGSLSELPGALCGRMMERMPDDFPPKFIMSALRRIQEQNEQLLALLREQNNLLRERLPVQEAPSAHSEFSGAEPQQD